MRFIYSFFRLWGWFALLATVLSVIAWFIATANIQAAQRLVIEGVETTAELTRVYRSTDKDSDGRTTYRYKASYRFTVAGKTYEDEQDLTYDFYQKIGTGQRIPARYWAKDPSVSEIEPGRTAKAAWIAGFGALALSFAALIFARLGLNRAASTTWMHRHGVKQHAMVTGHIKSWLSINNRPRWRATWRQEDGREGCTYLVRFDQLPNIGTYISILADPEGQRDSIWIGDL
jgi:Protein of unknown function (DUF3592)